MGIQSHQEQLPVFRRKLGHYTIMLGLTGLQLHNVMIRFQNQWIGFESSYCHQSCQYHSSVWVWGNHMETTVDPEESKFDIFYPRFILNHSRVVQPLAKLMKMLVLFHLRPNQKGAFVEHTTTFITATVLAHIDHKNEMVLEIDASSYMSRGVLS
jgi:hypothetical protein